VPVEITIYAKNIEVNAEAEAYIQKMFQRLERHLKSVSSAKLEVSLTSARSSSNRTVAQMTITTNGFTLRGQESDLNLFTVVDAVTDVMDRQIRRYKGKVYRNSQSKKSARADAVRYDAAAVEIEPSEDEDTVLTEFGKVVRTKRFQMKPMTVDDVVLGMEVLSHAFFVQQRGDAGVQRSVPAP
jgi:putative sigma-54 modulation protein